MFTRKPRLQPGKVLNSGAKDFCNTICNEPSFRQKRLIDIGIVPVFDSPEQFAEYLNGRKLIHESGFQPR
jgi:hypothetical protein